MKTVLDDILEKRRADLQATWDPRSEPALRTAADARVHHSLIARLRSPPVPRVVAEVKRQSPSAGVLLDPYDPAGAAAAYEQAGAAALSVLTEPRFFGGTGEDLVAVRRRVGLPLLCKDFIVDPIQILQAAAWGADAVLLIAAALKSDTCVALYQRALEWGLDVIVEVHAESEVETALRCAGAILGVNNRDLRTLETTLEVSRRIHPLIPVGRLCLSESGLRTAADLAELSALGFDGFLIGESLLRGGHPGLNLERLIRSEAP